MNEIYLNFAEAMNEAYGPDDKHGYKYSAREAINIIRERSGQPAILSGSGIYSDFRELVRNERAIELAFDNHRFWDVRRWMIAEQEGVDVYKRQVYGYRRRYLLGCNRGKWV